MAHEVEFAYHGQTEADTIDEVLLENQNDRVEIFNEETAVSDVTLVLYVTVDGDDPSVRGDDSYAIYPGYSREIRTSENYPTTVKLIASGEVKYSVTGLR